ncbi:MAG TPA: rRNA maturation RNase YbeY [Flavobacteriaceae bacterium]|nr:rRNA maturation RNase YbeY [Flavobacteriaceae bacterium]
MISFNYETDVSLGNKDKLKQWLSAVIDSEGYKEGEINYIFCDDDCLLRLNKKFLNHDTLTDIISFDYTEGKLINGDIYISVERVAENAREFNVPFANELQRVMAHGILHYCGYNDKSEGEIRQMRVKENLYLDRLQNI